MKALRSTCVRLTAALALAGAASFLPVSGAAADPSDPVCIVPPEEYCQNFVGYTPGTIAYRNCVHSAYQLQMGEYCNPIDWDVTSAKLD